MSTATKPKKINAKRLLKLAAFLDKLPRSHFDFGVVREYLAPSARNQCGTIACAIGWCPSVFPKLIKVRSFPTESYEAIGERLFDMPIHDAATLFSPFFNSPAEPKTLGLGATPKQVAKRIRTYVKWKLKQGVK